jgi:hypothetical protein
MCGHLTLRGKESQLRERLPIGIEDFDRFGPGCLLTIVDLPKVEDRSLYPVPPGRADLFDNAPIVMILPVFEAVVRVEKGLPIIDGGQSTSAARWQGRVQVCTKPKSDRKNVDFLRNSTIAHPKFAKTSAE